MLAGFQLNECHQCGHTFILGMDGFILRMPKCPECNSIEARNQLSVWNLCSSNWQRQSVMGKKAIVYTLYQNLCSLTPEQQDTFVRVANLPLELIAQYRLYAFNQKYQELNLRNSSNEIDKKQFLSECSIGNHIISMMKRLENACEDGIMNNLKFHRLDNGDYIIIHEGSNMPNTKAVISRNCVYARSGALKQGNQGLNEILNTPRAVPNTTYFIDGRSVYHHDSYGRLIKESTIYSQYYSCKSISGTENPKYVRKCKDGRADDDCSHSVPHCLGGPNEAINQTPMSTSLNRGANWRNKEGFIQNAVNLGLKIYVEHNYIYFTQSARPSKITAKLELSNCTDIEFLYENK